MPIFSWLLRQIKYGNSCEGISLTAQTPALLFGHPGLCSKAKRRDHIFSSALAVVTQCSQWSIRVSLREQLQGRHPFIGLSRQEHLPGPLLSEAGRGNRILRTGNEGDWGRGGSALYFPLPFALSPKWMKNGSLLL